MRNIMIASLAFALAACGGSSDEDVSGADNTQEFTVGETEATVSTGGDIEVELPLGFDTYPGSTVVSTMVVNNPEVQGRTVFMETGDSVSDVVAHYRQKAEAAGIAIGMETQSADTFLMAGQNEGDSGFNLLATTDGEKTTIQLSVTETTAGE